MSSVFTFDNGDSPGVFSVLSGLVLTAGEGWEQPWVPFSVSFAFLFVFLRLLAEDRDLEQPMLSFSVSSVFMGSLLESVQHKLHGISSRSIVKIWSYLENTYLSLLCCSPLFFSLFPSSPSQRQCLCFFVIFPQSEGKSTKHCFKKDSHFSVTASQLMYIVFVDTDHEPVVKILHLFHEKGNFLNSNF